MCLSLIPSPVHMNSELVRNRECIIEELLFSCETPKILSIHRWANRTKHSSDPGEKKPTKTKNTLCVEIQSKYRVNIKNSSKSYQKSGDLPLKLLKYTLYFTPVLDRKKDLPDYLENKFFRSQNLRKRIILFLLKLLKSWLQGCLPLKALWLNPFCLRAEVTFGT